MDKLLKLKPIGLGLILMLVVFIISLLLLLVSLWGLLLAIPMLAGTLIYILAVAEENDVTTIEEFFFEKEKPLSEKDF